MLLPFALVGLVIVMTVSGLASSQAIGASSNSGKALAKEYLGKLRQASQEMSKIEAELAKLGQSPSVAKVKQVVTPLKTELNSLQGLLGVGSGTTTTGGGSCTGNGPCTKP